MHDTLAGALTDTLTRPIKNLRRLRKLTVKIRTQITQIKRRYTLIKNKMKKISGNLRVSASSASQ